MSRELVLSKRMQSVADRVSSGRILADVGCDHGYLSIWLCQSGKIPSAIAMDVNAGPLKKAEENVSLYGLKDRIQLRLSDGLMKLQAGEVDAVAIAGMGGGLTIRILQARTDVVEQLKELILEPQSDVDQVRLYLESISFEIVDEDMVLEDGKFYPIIRAVPLTAVVKGSIAADKAVVFEEKEQNSDLAGKAQQTAESDTDADFSEEELLRLAQLRYGKILLEKKHPVLRLLIEHDQQQVSGILGHLRKNPTEKSLARIKALEKELSYMKLALKCFE